MHSNRPILPTHQSRILRLLRSEGPLSRTQLHERTGLRPNTVGEHVGELIERGLVREEAAQSSGPGRPRVPLTIDTDARHVVGVAIRPGLVEACRLNLRGQPLGRLHTQPVERPEETIAVVERAMATLIGDATLLTGLSTTGLVDTEARRILLSSALPQQHFASLDSLFAVVVGCCSRGVDDKPIIVENDMHALAARWLQEHHRQLDEDVLLVYLDDGQLGAALLVRGEPNWGCLVGGNELGHTRLPVETPLCYCGHTGCLERICSAAFVEALTPGDASRRDHTPLVEHIQQFDGSQPAILHMIDLLATGLSGAVNFIRPHRMVLVSRFTRFGPFMEELVRAIRSRIINALADRVSIHYVDQAATGAGEAAGWLALAAIYYPNWTKAILRREE
jgi:predicted NBD/HSP70 family sugar kinase